MSHEVRLTAADGHTFAAWRTDPAAESKGGVVVLHAVFGRTRHMAAVCDMYAAEGYAAVAPALYDRIGPDIVHPYGPDGVEAGRRSYAALDPDWILADIEAAAAALRSGGPVAVSGFCTGGSWAWTAAATLSFDASVNFYGSHVAQRLDLGPKCPTIMHYGDSDAIVPMPDVERIQAANPDVTIYVYPGARHAFFNPDQDSYDAGAAALAFQRSIAFLDGRFASAG